MALRPAGDRTGEASRGLHRSRGRGASQWCDPRALELVAGTPVSCLVVTWAEGSTGDEDQPASPGPLIAAARQPRALGRGMGGGTGRPEARRRHRPGRGPRRRRHRVQRARAGRRRPPLPRARPRPIARPRTSWVSPARSGPARARACRPAPTPRPAPRARPGWTPTPGTFASPAASWTRRSSGSRSIRPTSANPWRPRRTLQAIADTEVCGARWVVSLDPHLRRRPPGPARLGPGNLGRGSAAASPSSGSTAPGRATSRSDSSGWCPPTAGPTSSCRSRCSTCWPARAASTAFSRRAEPWQTPFDGLDAVLYVDERSSRGGSRPEALRVRRRRRDPDHAARLGGARGARGRRVALPVPRLPVRPRPARGGSRGARGPLPPGRGRAAPDEPPPRPGPALQRGHRPVPLRHERRRPLRRPARARLPDALSPKRR